jgi:hypothetical protein
VKGAYYSQIQNKCVIYKKHADMFAIITVHTWWYIAGYYPIRVCHIKASSWFSFVNNLTGRVGAVETSVSCMVAMRFNYARVYWLIDWLTSGGLFYCSHLPLAGNIRQRSRAMQMMYPDMNFDLWPASQYGMFKQSPQQRPLPTDVSCFQKAVH